MPESQHPKQQERLLKMAAEDQMMHEAPEDAQDADAIQERHAKALAEMVDAIGWPTEEKVGPEASVAAWLMVLHADHDPAFQEEMLGRMKTLEEGEIEPYQMAYLEDRILVNEEKKQKFGTQFFEDPEEGVKAYPIADKANLDIRREKMGLVPFEEHKREVQEASKRS